MYEKPCIVHVISGSHKIQKVTIRLATAACAAFFLYAVAARGQSWPSNADVFRDVYGRMDASGTSVRWDSSKESKPSPYVGHPFAETGQAMNVGILLRAEVDGRLYVATSAVPKGEPTEYQCHSCVAAVGGAVYSRTNGTWKLQASAPAAIYGGGWGDPPTRIDLRSCGPETYCFAVEDSFSGQGYSESTLKVFGPVGGSLQALLSVPSESDNAGAYDPRGVDGPDMWKRMSASMRFLSDYNSKSPFFDLELIGAQRSCSKGHCRSSWKHRRYRYREGRYVAINLGASPGQ